MPRERMLKAVHVSSKEAVQYLQERQLGQLSWRELGLGKEVKPL